MSFMLKKKRYRFGVDLNLDELTEVSYGKGIMFAKVRQLDGGSFTDVSKRVEVRNHMIKYNERFHFPCKMSASNGILETCKCRISIRMEEKGGKHFRKIGFADINLSEYAGAGPSTQRYILQAYETSHRLDNSMLQITLNITLKEGDTIFQRPLTRRQPISLPGEDDGSSSSGVVVSGSTSLTIPTATTELVQRTNTVSATSGSALPGITSPTGAVQDGNSHTRNSSAASQGSAGYSSSNGQTSNPPHPPAPLLSSCHSRHSSSGDSSHGRNLSQGSSDTGFFGSMEKEKNRRKKLDEGRVDAELVINELMEGVDLDKVGQDETETSGLQLFVGKDGSVTFDKSSSRKKDYEPVVIVDNLK